MDRIEEQKLLRLAQQGSSDAFAALYRAHVQSIFRYIYHRVNNIHVAEDLTSDVFTRALDGLRLYRDQGKPFLAWLYSIAHARVIDHYRRARVSAEQDDADEIEAIADTPDLDQNLLHRQAAAALRQALIELTGEQQQVVILRFIEGYRLEQVAEVMGKNANAIKALQHRALRALATRLERSGFDIEAILAGLDS